MSYMSDWIAQERAAAAIAAQYPGCDQTPECPAERHTLDCRRWRLWHKRTGIGYVRADGRTDEKLRQES